jgi:hypothetical protein
MKLNFNTKLCLVVTNVEDTKDESEPCDSIVLSNSDNHYTAKPIFASLTYVRLDRKRTFSDIIKDNSQKSIIVQLTIHESNQKLSELISTEYHSLPKQYCASLDKVMFALYWLQIHSPLYKDINVIRL